MQITSGMVKELREKTGAGLMDCKAALTASVGDMEAAIDHLRKKGLAAAAKKSSRIASEGVVCAHVEGNSGVLVEVNCETDFVARTDDFAALAKDLAMQVAAANPSYVGRNDVPASVIEREKTIYREQARASGKPDKILDKIADGKLEKYFGDFCLVEQAFIKDPDRKVSQLLADAGKAAGAPVAVYAFGRFQVGEGMEKRSDDLAAEVAKQLGQG